MSFRKGKKSNNNSDDDVSDCSSLSQSVFHTTSFNPFKLSEFCAEKEETENISTFVQPGADRNKLEQDHSLPREDTIVNDDFSQNGIEVEAVEFSGAYDAVKNYDDIHKGKRRDCCSRRMILFLIAFAIIMIASGIVGYLALKMTNNKSSKSSAAAGLVDEEGADVVDVNTNSSDEIIDISPNDAAGEDNSANNDAEIDLKEEIDNKQKEDSLWSDSAPRPTPTTPETAVPTTASIPDDTSTTNGPASSTATSPQEDNDNNENVSESESESEIESESETTDSETTDIESTDPTPAPTPQQTVPVTDVSTTAVTLEVTDSPNNCPDHSLVVSSNCVEDDSTTAFSMVQYCFATKRDGDWYWIRGTGDDEGSSGYDSWDYTDEMEGQLTLLDLGKGNYEISLVRDSRQPYDVITTHNFTVPECVAK